MPGIHEKMYVNVLQTRYFLGLNIVSSRAHFRARPLVDFPTFGGRASGVS